VALAALLGEQQHPSRAGCAAVGDLSTAGTAVDEMDVGEHG